ncbi:MAG: folylpolyglutamate synthase/dihydrofolate synthase family protein [Halieaceae bacterium]
MSAAELNGWLARLESLHPEEIELGLDRVAEVAGRLSVLQAACPVVTVAGTNGKGSTVAVIEALALHAGKSVGSYTSPHLLRYNERVRLNGLPVSDATLVDAFTAVESARGQVPLTYFEFGTLAALAIFRQAAPQLVILEVGLGGRLDAVNIIDPDVAVITSISEDHQSWLGTDRETIGREKAGILRTGIKAVIADPDPPVTVIEALTALQCDYSLHDHAAAALLQSGPLRPENVAGALKVADHLGFMPPADEVSALLAELRLPGRLQQLRVADRRVIVDVAHNPAAVANLADWLEKCAPGRCFALFAALSDKDIHAMIRACQGCFSGWYLTALPEVPRALEVGQLASILDSCGVEAVVSCENPAAAWQRAQAETDEADTLVIFGSFYTVAGFLQCLEEEQAKA